MDDFRTSDFNNILDDVFLITKEMISNHGEDNFYCSYNKSSAIVAVFDGCGGLGSRKYDCFGGRTGAYMASRVVSGAVHDWFNEYNHLPLDNQFEIVDSIKSYINEAYEKCESYSVSNLRIRGSMVRDFPTTAAIAYAKNVEEELKLYVFWAGDSRVYLLSKDGLHQLTKDDVDGEDALSNLSNDGSLTNVLSSDGKYEIHCNVVEVDGPALVFAATDGCFGYVPTPMEFEYMILSTLIQSVNPELFKNNLSKKIAEYAGDDFALGMMSFLYGNYENIRQSYMPRVNKLRDQYINEIQNNREQTTILRLWETYKSNYEKYLV